MLTDLVGCLLLFPLVVVGLAWPMASKLALEPAEKLCAAIVLSVLGVYLFGFAVYLLGLPAFSLWALPVLAAFGLMVRRPALANALANLEARELLMGQFLVAAWCVGWLALVASYSGGGWAGDWFEHWERLRFFRERWPTEAKFLGFYPLPARPPLANIVAGALLPTHVTFAGYQLVTTLLNALAFFPAGLLARRFQRGLPGSGRLAIALVAVLLMVNPLFVENATFAWTKLIAAFFILSGWYFFLRAHDPDAPPAVTPLCAASLAAGVLAHYSAAPFVVVLAIAWFAPALRRMIGDGFWRQTFWAGVISVAILATWLAWSFATYGTHTTLLSNSSVSVPEAREGNQLLKIALNLRDTVVPHFLRPLDPSLIAQRSPWGYWRDWFFQLYQLNLLFAFGSLAWIVVTRELLREWRENSGTKRAFWAASLPGVIFLGVAVHGARDTWGLMHICLQSVEILGLAFLAARWSSLSRAWRLVVIAGAAIDVLAGIALNFAVQNFALDRWLTPDRDAASVFTSYSASAVMNLRGKLQAQLVFVNDAVGSGTALVLALLAAILTLAFVRVARARTSV